jgi:CRISPR-associated protein Csm3
MRSLSERVHGKEQNFKIGKGVFIHTCQGKGMSVEEYHEQFKACPVCSVFGVTGDEPVPHPTSLIVRDVMLSDASAEALEKAQTDFPFTEIKWEATIDRVTSAATPRQIERVPAGSVFEGFELVYGIYDASGRDHFQQVLTAMQLVEEDYLGGLGSRGGGKIEFEIKSVYVRSGENYQRKDFDLPEDARLTDDLVNSINAWVQSAFEDIIN